MHIIQMISTSAVIQIYIWIPKKDLNMKRILDIQYVKLDMSARYSLCSF